MIRTMGNKHIRFAFLESEVPVGSFSAVDSSVSFAAHSCC
jgi:hypothetical protein